MRNDHTPQSQELVEHAPFCPHGACWRGHGRNRPGGLPAPGFSEAKFVRIDDGTPLRRDELLFRYKVRGRRVITASPSFYFQEGEAAIYEQARYARVKADENGRTRLVALCDARGLDLKPDEKAAPKPGRDSRQK